MKQLQGFHQTRHVWLKSYAWHYRTLYLKKKEKKKKMKNSNILLMVKFLFKKRDTTKGLNCQIFTLHGATILYFHNKKLRIKNISRSFCLCF